MVVKERAGQHCSALPMSNWFFNKDLSGTLKILSFQYNLLYIRVALVFQCFCSKRMLDPDYLFHVKFL